MPLPTPTREQLEQLLAVRPDGSVYYIDFDHLPLRKHITVRGCRTLPMATALRILRGQPLPPKRVAAEQLGPLLKEAVTYCPDTGELRPTGMYKVAIRHYCGYIAITAFGKLTLGHRYAWYVMRGEWPPKKMCIDHVNRIRDDNRWENLRLATYQQNFTNSGARKNNTSGYKGVHKDGRRWVATICKDRKAYRLGRFDTPEAAYAAYCRAAAELHGDFACVA